MQCLSGRKSEAIPRPLNKSLTNELRAELDWQLHASFEPPTRDQWRSQRLFFWWPEGWRRREQNQRRQLGQRVARFPADLGSAG